jgi:microcin C transport system substrate-binding protein
MTDNSFGRPARHASVPLIFCAFRVEPKARAQGVFPSTWTLFSLMPLLRLTLITALTGFLLAPAYAEDPGALQKDIRDDTVTKHHAVSLVGEPKYPPDFTHFGYVNPDAPKGGVARFPSIGGFDSLNPVLYRGEQAAGLGLVTETLMSDSIDEPSTSYGLIAEWASYPEDYSSVTFKLRDAARWHDGTPITPEDVIYSLDVNKKANPRLGLYYKNVSHAEVTGDNEVTFFFDMKGNRELPMIMGQLTILPKH